MILNLDKIHPCKRDKLRKGLEYVQENDANRIISKIVIFGSSIKESCREDSDIDICIMPTTTTNTVEACLLLGGFSRVLDNDTDMIDYTYAGETLRKEIDTTGLIVYTSQ